MLRALRCAARLGILALASADAATILPEREGWLSHFRRPEPGGVYHVGSYKICGGSNDKRGHDHAASVDRERPRRGDRGASANGDMVGHIERLMIDKVTGRV